MKPSPSSAPPDSSAAADALDSLLYLTDLAANLRLSLNHLRLLLNVHTGKHPRPTDLGHAMGISTAAAAQIAHLLIRRGYLTKARSTTDERVVHYTLTPKGTDLINRLTRLTQP